MLHGAVPLGSALITFPSASFGGILSKAIMSEVSCTSEIIIWKAQGVPQ